MSKSFARRVAHSIAESWFLRRGKRLWGENQKDWNLPLSRKDKVLSGIYVIMAHFSEGRFPPTFSDQQKVYEIERSLKACDQAYACLKPGGWFLMCNEPN